MEERNYKLYVHISPNGKRYYGITSLKIEHRWNNGYGYHTQQYFYRAINKYGWENFQHLVLFDNLTKDEACLLEQCYIALYDTANPKYGYNNSLGGEHGLTSEQTKKKISKAMKGKNYGKQRTEETKKKISENNAKYWKGKQFTEEHKKKISENNPKYWEGKQFTEEHKKKLSEARKGENNPKYWEGKQRTEETKKKISEARKGKCTGKNNPMYGKKGKDNPVSKPVLMFTLEGEFIKRFDCIAEANEYLGKPRSSSNITMCARGARKTAHGYIWIYEEDYIKQEQAI